MTPHPPHPIHPPLRRLHAALAAPLVLWAAAAAAQGTPPAPDPVLPAVRAQAAEEPQGKDSLRATHTRVGKGEQPLRDLPQSLTVITERLLDDRNLDTLKEALRSAAGVSFQAAEGGEEDIRIRGFSLQASGDLFIDGLRDPAFYERDAFNWDRLEVLRGSASMLFGRGSTGGAVNQVSKQPTLFGLDEASLTVGSRGLLRGTVDLNRRLGEDAALRLNLVGQHTDPGGLAVRKAGIAPALRWGIGQRDEFSVGLYHLDNRNGIPYGLPWLPAGATGGNGLWPVAPAASYGMASDFNRTGTTQAQAGHRRRLDHGGEWRTQLRVADYWRDQRASAIRFAAAAVQPDGLAVNAERFTDATVLTRGTNNKNMALRSAVLQSELSAAIGVGAHEHRLNAGVDAGRERFDNRGATLPAGVTLTKPNTTVGSPDDGAVVDEALRQLATTRRFRADAAGLYAQDLVTLTPVLKLLAGLRLDRFSGRYETVVAQGAAGNPCSVAAGTRLERSDTLWSRRLGLLLQPDERSAYHLSYGTSFNTSGDTYQFDAGTARTPPESSRNVELGARLESAGGRLSTRVALFHSTKYNERNRDAESVDACNYRLSGRRHAAGLELDVAGRPLPGWELFVSYAWIPEARVDASSGAAGTEAVGSRPGLTPRHSGSLWSTWRVDARWRAGLGLNARGRDKPVGLAAGSTIAAPGFATLDLMAEHVRGDLSVKLLLVNLADRHVADTLYRGHYVPGRPRSLALTVAQRF